jgi:hypothetical protein
VLTLPLVDSIAFTFHTITQWHSIQYCLYLFRWSYILCMCLSGSNNVYARVCEKIWSFHLSLATTIWCIYILLVSQSFIFHIWYSFKLNALRHIWEIIQEPVYYSTALWSNGPHFTDLTTVQSNTTDQLVIVYLWPSGLNLISNITGL